MKLVLLNARAQPKGGIFLLWRLKSKTDLEMGVKQGLLGAFNAIVQKNSTTDGVEVAKQG